MTATASHHTSAPAGVIPVRPFSDLSVDDVTYAGGKGANLGQLTGAGLPVPPGFVVGAPAYAAFRRETGLGHRLAELLSGVDVEDTEGTPSVGRGRSPGGQRERDAGLVERGDRDR